MKIRCSILFGLVCMGMALTTMAAPARVNAEAEIVELIQAVALSGCEFERNGKRYDSVEAADHLQLKYSRGKRYARTAEQFIDRLASKSSITGKPYLIICAKSGEHRARDWLEDALNAQRKSR